jgi:diketogulonate reductase-like aldo/keto reductase
MATPATRLAMQYRKFGPNKQQVSIIGQGTWYIERAAPRQVALSFLTHRPSVFAIPKASNPQHTEENAGAARLHLTEEELLAIEQEFPLGPPRRGIPTL